MNYLITGGAGFIGFHLAKKLLLHGNEVTIVDNLERGEMDSELKELLKNKKLKFSYIDLLKENSLEELNNNYDFIFHLAAVLGVENVLKNSYKVLDINKKLLSNVISFASRQKNLKKLFFTSTSEIYAGTLKKSTLVIPTPEDSNIVLPDLNHPRTSYMLSKAYGEAMCFASSLPVIILRPHNIFGQRMGMAHVIPQLIKRAFNTPKNGQLGIYSPSHTRAFCYIKDAIDSIYKLIELNLKENNVFNLGTSEPEITMLNLAKEIINIMDRGDINLIELEDTPGSPRRRCPDTKKIDNISGIKKRTDLAIGIAQTYKWYNDRSEYFLNK